MNKESMIDALEGAVDTIKKMPKNAKFGVVICQFVHDEDRFRTDIHTSF